MKYINKDKNVPGDKSKSSKTGGSDNKTSLEKSINKMKGTLNQTTNNSK